MISRSWTKDPPHPLAPFTPYHRKNLQLFVSSLMRTSPQGSFVPLAPHVEPQSSLFGRKMAHFGFASTSEASTGQPRKTAARSHSSLIYWTHPEKHESTPRSTYGTHTIWSTLQPGTNGRLHSGPDMGPLSGWQ